MPANDQRLNDPVDADGFRELFNAVMVELRSWLKRVRIDFSDGHIRDRPTLIRPGFLHLKRRRKAAAAATVRKAPYLTLCGSLAVCSCARISFANWM